MTVPCRPLSALIVVLITVSVIGGVVQQFWTLKIMEDLGIGAQLLVRFVPVMLLKQAGSLIGGLASLLQVVQAVWFIMIVVGLRGAMAGRRVTGA